VQQQDWDPSVQALVLFPNVLQRLNEDIRWTTDLGNAFLAQQQAVMDAVQRMRQSARNAGRLPPTPQQNIVTDGESIAIEPAYPNVIYVPIYDPAWIWGPPLWYPYPLWIWPPHTVIIRGLWWGWSPAINVGIFFGVGWYGWGGWGWYPVWHDHRILVNNGFVHEYGLNGSHLGFAHGTTIWRHDPGHRAGIPYPNSQLREQYRGNVRQSISPRAAPESGRGNPPATERMGDRNVTPNARENRSAFGQQENGPAATRHEEHGLSSMGPQRSAPVPVAPPRAPQPRMPAPSPQPRMPAPAPRTGRGGH
jgi:hypothetical protein